MLVGVRITIVVSATALLVAIDVTCRVTIADDGILSSPGL